VEVEKEVDQTLNTTETHIDVIAPVGIAVQPSVDVIQHREEGLHVENQNPEDPVELEKEAILPTKPNSLAQIAISHTLPNFDDSPRPYPSEYGDPSKPPNQQCDLHISPTVDTFELNLTGLTTRLGKTEKEPPKDEPPTDHLSEKRKIEDTEPIIDGTTSKRQHTFQEAQVIRTPVSDRR
jgi:hypothetical protein